MRTDDIRKTFLDFFKSNGHEIVPSDSLVPKDDPTLLFTGAGMNQFKERFLGRNITYRRAASSQKCLRTADLENVGKTAGHHTFFEMLGNFSFGDYFKKEAIQWAWEFLTKVLKIKRERLWASVYTNDDEAYNIWKSAVRMPARKIIKFGAKENFWPSEAPTKGPDGPCGPCSEIFYDYGEGVGCGNAHCDPRCDCGRFVEVWNLVFTQFDRQSDGSLKGLPNKNIDTGMGLERLASVMQGVVTNFEIDIFKPIVEEIASAAFGSLAMTDVQHSTLNARRINAIADHIRAVTFCIADGVMPSNEERGYIARKLIRRSALHGREIGIGEPFLYKLVAVVSDVMGYAYPDVRARRDDTAQIVKKEEENFLFVLETQLPKVEEAFQKMQKARDAQAIASSAFNFYDTYGMPYDMLEDAAERFGLKIDKKRFEDLLERQRERSRARSKIKGEIFSQDLPAKKVEAIGLKTEFLGYDASEVSAATVLAVLDGGEVILDKTPFYGESGGQAGDRGRIETASGVMEVEDAKRMGDAIVHIGRMLRGRIVKDELARVLIDEDARKKTMLNHTATHLLQAALRKTLGEHVRQTGSLVDKDHLRFDFTHMKKMEGREVARVEEIVNDYIKSALSVKKELKAIEEAKAEGATALFGEKYAERVRVITIEGVSKELCGGTHIDNTAQIGIFKITSESSIASGVRRIEALTGDTALDWIEKQKTLELARLRSEEQEEEAREAMGKRLSEEIARIDLFIERAQSFGGVKVVNEIIEEMDLGCLRILSDKIRKREGSAVIILSTRTEDKASFLIAITDVLAKKGLNAGLLASQMAKAIDGSGGGKNIFAQGGGRRPSNLEAALDGMTNALKATLTGGLTG